MAHQSTPSLLMVPALTMGQSALQLSANQTPTAQELITQHLATGDFSSTTHTAEPPRPKPVPQGRYYCPVCPPVYTYTYRTKNEAESWTHVNHCRLPAVARSPYTGGRLVFSCIANTTCQFTTLDNQEFHQHIWHHQIVGDNRFDRLPGNKVLLSREGAYAFDQQYPDQDYKSINPSEAWFEKNEEWKASEQGQRLLEKHELGAQEDEADAKRVTQKILNSTKVDEIVIPRVYAWLAEVQPLGKMEQEGLNEHAFDTNQPQKYWFDGNLMTINGNGSVERAAARDIKAYGVVVPAWLESQRRSIEEAAL